MNPKDIEQLFKEHLANDQENPPQEVWEKISLNMDQRNLPSKGGRDYSKVFSKAGLGLISFAAIGLIGYAFLNNSHQVSVNPKTEEIVSINQSSIEQEKTSPSEEQNPSIIKPSKPVIAKQESPKIAEIIIPQESEINNNSPRRENRLEERPSAPGNNQVSNPEKTQEKALEYNQPQTPTPSTEVSPSSEKEVIELGIPNLISPNGDNYNDCWKIVGIEKYPNVQVRIQSPGKQTVFSSNHYQNEFCGDDLPDGTYYYLLVIPDKSYKKTGCLLIKRQ